MAMVTIIITTCKRKPEMVVRAVKSACDQTYKNIEIVVVDDSPCDYEYREKVRSEIYSLGDPRVKVIWHEKNMGACVARNTAINNSTGEFVIYLDDDDEFLPQMVEKRLSGFTRDTIGLVYGTRYLCPNNDKTRLYVPKQKLVSGYIFNETIKKNNIAAFPMVRRECFEKVGMFDEAQLSAQDYEMWLRILQKYEANYIDEPLAIVHLHNEGRITSTPYKAIQGTTRICELYRDYYKKHAFAFHFRKQELCKLYCVARDKKTALRFWVEAAFMGPTDVLENLRLLKQVILIKKNNGEQ